ncbi:MAG: VWA domain-containing protein [Planctomycetes bacterium]|nr:VWA domain-containing protein [Planctomycetota bacterium]MBT4029850.1 VWA domain-containing protein [Planctomycetota bacterium]MBT4559944.1 VWA domain-containing protein [Planctomycetota bacterium]MBT7012111.1 VWA domain-containing protein [Planctomycetota bacterium]MBT7318265.1 VWA domain-containing protein [Planctomycetota bacterium]
MFPLSSTLFGVAALIVSLGFASPAAGQDLGALRTSLEFNGWQKDYSQRKSAQALSKIHTAEAMQLRLDVFDGDHKNYKWVGVRDWLFDGFLLANSFAENELLAQAAQNRKNLDLLRELALRGLLANKGKVPAKPLLDKKFLKAPLRIRLAWQECLGALVGTNRLDGGKKMTASAAEASAREVLLKAGAPFAGHLHFKTLQPAEIAAISKALLKSKDPHDRALCLRVLGRHKESYDAFLQAAGPALRGDALGPFVAVVEEGVDAQLAPLIPLLITALEIRTANQGSGRLIRDLASALRELSGQSFGLHPDSWRNWWSHAGSEFLAKWRAGGNPGTQKHEAQKDGTVAKLFGLPIDSHRIYFLVDGSGSMVKDKIGGKTIAEAAADELAAFLDALPSDAEANLILVANEPILSLKTLKPLTKKIKAQLVSDVRDFHYNSASALVEALRLAQSDASVDTIVLIGDGGSTRGMHGDYNRHIVAENFREHLRSGVRLHCIALTQSSRKQGFMRLLAEQTSGRLVIPAK